MSNKTIMRFEKGTENPYTMISNSVLRDKKLSWKARGILAYLLSLPDDWQIYESELIKHATDGRDSLRSGIKELEGRGYLLKERIRDENGRLQENKYTIFDHVHCNDNGVTTDGFSNVGKTNVGKTNIGKSPTTKELPYERLTKLNTNCTEEPAPKKEEVFTFGEYENVKLTEKEYEKLLLEITDGLDYIERLSGYIASSGKKYKSHYATIRNWYNKDKREQEKKPNQQSSGSFMDIDF